MTPSSSDDGGKSTILQKMLNPLRPKKGAVKDSGSSYFALFRPLHDVQSRLILVIGVVLALAAGAPLPIIGVIFARIIDAFPPSEEEIRTRVYELLAVGRFSCSKGYFRSTEFYSNRLLCYHVGMDLLLGYRRRSNIQRPSYPDGPSSSRTRSDLLRNPMP
jgi:hypothetical protein